ncbi:hypothetical protein [Kitasatospora sp. NPDC004289]
MSSRAPLYRQGDVLEESAAPERRLLVLGVGHETYWLRAVAGHREGEPLEAAWAIEGCEAATRCLEHLWPVDPRTVPG